MFGSGSSSRSGEAGSPAAAGRRRALALVFLLAAGVLWAALFTTSRFTLRDAYDYAQLGRQLRTHQGFTTWQLFPRNIPYFDRRGQLDGGPWPSLYRYPAPIVTSAIFQLFSSDIITAAVVQSGVFYVLSVPLLFLLAARLTHPGAASLATLLYLGDPRVVRAAYDGMTEALATVVLLLVFHAAFRPATLRGQKGSWLLLGLLCGLAYLTRTQLIFLPPLALLLALLAVERHRLRSALLLVAGMAAAISPWLARNYAVAGDPFFAFTSTRALLVRTESYHTIDRVLDAPVDFPTVIRSYGGEIADKIWHNLWPALVDPRFWLQVLGIYAVCLPILVLGLFVRRRPERRLLPLFEISVLVFCLANFFLVSTTNHVPRYYDGLIPLLAIVLAHWIWRLTEADFLRRTAGTRKLALAALAAVFLLAGYRGFVTFSEHARFPAPDPSSERSFQILARTASSEQVIVSDRSLEVTARIGNPTIRLPVDPREIFEIDRRYLAVEYVLLSERFARRPAYKSFIESPAFRDRYRLRAELPDRALLFQKIQAHDP